MSEKVPCGGFKVSNGLLETADGSIYPNGGESVDVYIQCNSKEAIDDITNFYIGSFIVVKDNKIIYFDKAPSDYYTKDTDVADAEEKQRVQNFLHFIRSNGFQDFRLWRYTSIVSSEKSSFTAQPFRLTKTSRILSQESNVGKKVDDTYELIGGNYQGVGYNPAYKNFQIWRIAFRDASTQIDYTGSCQKGVLKLAFYEPTT